MAKKFVEIYKLHGITPSLLSQRNLPPPFDSDGKKFFILFVNKIH